MPFERRRYMRKVGRSAPGLRDYWEERIKVRHRLVGCLFRHLSLFPLGRFVDSVSIRRHGSGKHQDAAEVIIKPYDVKGY
jgi:hypothetical protein